MIRWTGLAPWEFGFPFLGRLTSTVLRNQSDRIEVIHRLLAQPIVHHLKPGVIDSGLVGSTDSHPSHSHVGRVPRGQKMLKGYRSKVMYH